MLPSSLFTPLISYPKLYTGWGGGLRTYVLRSRAPQRLRWHVVVFAASSGTLGNRLQRHMMLCNHSPLSLFLYFRKTFVNFFG